VAGQDPSEMKGSVCERKGGRSVRETSRLAFCRLNWIEGMAQKEQCRDRIGGKWGVWLPIRSVEKQL
jgi:hypothetical protein